MIYLAGGVKVYKFPRDDHPNDPLPQNTDLSILADKDEIKTEGATLR